MKLSRIMCVVASVSFACGALACGAPPDGSSEPGAAEQSTAPETANDLAADGGTAARKGESSVDVEAAGRCCPSCPVMYAICHPE